MKIVFVSDYNPFAPSGGIELNTRCVCHELQRMGHEVAIAYLADWGDFTIPDVRTIPLGSCSDVEKTIDEYKLVIVLASMSARPLFLLTSQILIEQKRKFLAYFRATSSHRVYSSFLEPNVSQMEDRLDNLSAIMESSYTVLIANSHAMKANLIKNYPALRTRNIYVVYPGISWPSDRPVSQFEQSKLHFNFINVGRIDINKGSLFLWEAFYLLYQEFKTTQTSLPIALHFLGDGPLRPALQALSEIFSITDAVNFWGNVSHDQVFAHLAAGDVLVHPSLTESFGQVIVEALGMGIPVIASDFEGMAELVGKVSPETLVPRANAWEIKNSMQRMLDSTYYEHIRSMIKPAQIRRLYNIPRQTQEILEAVCAEGIY